MRVSKFNSRTWNYFFSLRSLSFYLQWIQFIILLKALLIAKQNINIFFARHIQSLSSSSVKWENNFFFFSYSFSFSYYCYHSQFYGCCIQVWFWWDACTYFIYDEISTCVIVCRIIITIWWKMCVLSEVSRVSRVRDANIKNKTDCIHHSSHLNPYLPISTEHSRIIYIKLIVVEVPWQLFVLFNMEQ